MLVDQVAVRKWQWPCRPPFLGNSGKEIPTVCYWRTSRHQVEGWDERQWLCGTRSIAVSVGPSEAWFPVRTGW